MPRPHRRRILTTRKIGEPRERQPYPWLYRHRSGPARGLRHQPDSPPKEVNPHWYDIHPITEEKSKGNNMAAMGVGAIIGVCGFVIYRRKKA